MCARYVFFSGKVFSDEFGAVPIPGLEPSYNIAPTQLVPGVVQNGAYREARLFKWGLVPYWAKDDSIGVKLINARAETLREKPSFRAAFAKRRCLLPADGFFEWTGEKGAKQPHYISCTHAPFAFAGLYEVWQGPEGPLETCTIVTTVANHLVGRVHTRMPVIISLEDQARWLDPGANPDDLTGLFAPYPDELMTIYPVTRSVGNPRFNDPSAVVPLAG